MNYYLLNFEIYSGLKCYGKQFEFCHPATEKVIFPTPRTDCPYSEASVIVKANNFNEAHEIAHNALQEVLSLFSFAISSANYIKDLNYCLKNEKGLKRHLYIRNRETQEMHLYLTDEIAKEINSKLKSSLPDNIKLALNFLRWAHNADNVPVTFIFFWLAFEKIVGNEKVSKSCSICHDPLVCRKCMREDSYNTLPKDKAEKILTGLGFNKPFNDLWKLRQKIFHGVSSFTSTDIRILYDMLPPLRESVEKILDKEIHFENRINVRKVAKGKSVTQTHIFCSFETNNPQDRFASDSPSFSEIEESDPNRKDSRNIELKDISDLDNW